MLGVLVLERLKHLRGILRGILDTGVAQQGAAFYFVGSAHNM